MGQNKKITILFTSVGRRVELVQQFRKAAESLHVRLWLIGADVSLDAPALFYCNEQVQVCRIRDEAYIPQLLDICKEKEVDLLIPTIDTDLLLLASKRHLFEEIGCRVLISEPDKISICRDKRYTSDFFVKCGLKAPMPVDQVKDYQQGFPAFIKPKDGSSSIDAYRVEYEKDLKVYAGKIKDYIIQPFIDGREYTIDVFCDFDGNPIYITPRERIAVRSGEVLKTQIVQDDVMIDECHRIIRAFKPCGPITVQMIRQKETGEDYYIEINPRFGGGAPLSMKAGADAAKMLLRLLQGEKLSYHEKAAKEQAVYSRFDQSILIQPKAELCCVEDLQQIKEYCGDLQAVIFDLDDTLYLEKDYVRSGYRKVAQLLPEVADAYEKLWTAFEQGQNVIDQVLLDEGIYSEECKQECLDCYRWQEPDIALSLEVKTLLEAVRESGRKIGILTDGRVEGQRAKIKALGLEELVDEIIITDELAGKCGDVANFRKPSDIGFRLMQLRLNVPFEKMAYVGDNRKKDFAAPLQLGMKAVWYKNRDGLYWE